MKCTPGETALGMPESGNNVERAKEFSIYFVLMPSWVNKRLFYSGGPRWLGTIIQTKHQWLRLSTKHNCRLSLRKWWYGCPSLIGQHIMVGPCPTFLSWREVGSKTDSPATGASPITLFHPNEATLSVLHCAKSPAEHQARSVEGIRFFSSEMRA